MSQHPSLSGSNTPEISALVELLKPITWFPPMWAFGCGVVASGVSISSQPLIFVIGIVLTGPLVCGASQIVNDWYDRDVDAINEPNRAIPSGRVPGKSALYFFFIWATLCLLVSATLGLWVLGATVVGLILAWVYSAPPLRLKRNGWWGNAAVGVSYEGVGVGDGTAAMIGGEMPGWEVLVVAALYSFGAHGIMTLNDFKSVAGDLETGIRSIPARYGIRNASWIACVMMTLPQLVVIGLLLYWQQIPHAAIVGGLVLLQFLAMKRFFTDPKQYAPWYNGTGVSLYVLGMLVAAFALRSLVG